MTTLPWIGSEQTSSMFLGAQFRYWWAGLAMFFYRHWTNGIVKRGYRTSRALRARR